MWSLGKCRYPCDHHKSAHQIWGIWDFNVVIVGPNLKTTFLNSLKFFKKSPNTEYSVVGVSLYVTQKHALWELNEGFLILVEYVWKIICSVWVLMNRTQFNNIRMFCWLFVLRGKQLYCTSPFIHYQLICKIYNYWHMNLGQSSYKGESTM